MRYNPTECWAGLRDYSKGTTHTIDIAKDYVVKCLCPPGYAHHVGNVSNRDAPSEGACRPRLCPKELPQQTELEGKVSDPECGGQNKFNDNCALKCAGGYGHGSVTFTCSKAGRWVSDQVLECSAINVLKIEPVVMGELFRMPVPRFVTRLGFDFSHSTFEAKACVEHNITGGVS